MSKSTQFLLGILATGSIMSLIVAFGLPPEDCKL